MSPLHRILAALAILTVPQIFCEDLPIDVRDVLQKLEAFEAEQKEKYEQIVSKKRKAVAEFLETVAQRESGNGNITLAAAIRAEAAVVAHLEGKAPTAASRPPGAPVVKTKFHEWLESVIFRSKEGVQLWWVEGDKFMIDQDPSDPGFNRGSIVEVDDRQRTVHFKRGPTDEEGMYLEVEHNRKEAQILWPNGRPADYLEVQPRGK